VSTNTFMDTNGKRRANKRWPEALMREIVAATLVRHQHLRDRLEDWKGFGLIVIP
jgi:hypothetical protein